MAGKDGDEEDKEDSADCSSMKRLDEVASEVGADLGDKKKIKGGGAPHHTWITCSH
jgi:hypothetical protein